MRVRTQWPSYSPRGVIMHDGMSSSSTSPSSECGVALAAASDAGSAEVKQPLDDVRRAKHREVQRRFVERKKVNARVSTLNLAL